VRRDDDPKDRRVYRVTLTSRGKKLWQQARPLYLAAAAEVTSGLSAGRVREAIELLRTVEKAAAAWRRTDAVPAARKKKASGD
jgi:DNA-binding MarR family transcriptional regulator